MPKNNNIIDVDLSVIRKKRFRIDKDDSKIVEIDTSDMGIVKRLGEVEEKLQDLTSEAKSIQDDSTIEDMVTTLDEIDLEMRKYIDYVFDTNLCEIASPSGNMYDPFNGKHRYEHIIEVFGALYEDNLSNEIQKLHKSVAKHTSKYTGKK